jgi:hypothetical protein
MKKIGTRIEVMNGGAKQTRGGYTKKTLRYTKGGNIVPVRLLVGGGFLNTHIQKLKEAAQKKAYEFKKNPKFASLGEKFKQKALITVLTTMKGMKGMKALDKTEINAVLNLDNIKKADIKKLIEDIQKRHQTNFQIPPMIQTFLNKQ